MSAWPWESRAALGAPVLARGLSGQVRNEDAVADLGHQIAHAARGVGEQDRVRVGALAKRPDHVGVLSQSDERHRLAGVEALLGDDLERLPEPFGDRLPLGGDPLALEAHGLLLALGLLDRQRLLSVALRTSRDLVSLGGVDVVHRVLDSLVGLDVRHQRLDDLVAVFRHLPVQGLLDVHRDRVGIRVRHVEIHARDVRADNVEGVGLHLHLGVLKLVEGVLDLLGLGADLVLDRQVDVDEDVVQGLGLDVGVELLDLEAHPSCDALDEWRLGLQARARHSDELAEPLDDRAFLLGNGEEEEWHDL